MADNKPRAFSKKYGTRKEVFDGVAVMTRGGLTLEELFVDEDGVIRSLKQAESLKKSQNNLVKKEKKDKVVKLDEVPHDSDDSEDGDLVVNNSEVEEESQARSRRTKAVPTKALNISDIKEAVQVAMQKNNDKLPKGHSKWKKCNRVELYLA